MKRKLLWVLFNGGAVLLFWFGCLNGVQGAKNLLLFMVWFNLILSLFLGAEKVKADFVKKGRTFSVWVTVPFDIVMTAAFIWIGMWFTGAAYAFASLAQNGVYMEAEEKAVAA